MACGPSCTDCPACRGEIPHDAPAMHDLRWGMMQALDAHPYWATQSVAQILRQAAQGRPSADPASIALSRFVAGVGRQALPEFVPVRWRAISDEPPMPGPAPSEPPPEGLPPGQGRFRSPTPGALPPGLREPPDPTPPPIPPRQLSAEELAVLRALPGVGEPRGSSKGICCPDEFRYPSVIKRWAPDYGLVDDPDNPGKTRAGVRLRVFFNWIVTFKPESKDDPATAGCDCACCEFKHVVLRSVITQDGRNVHPVAAGGEDDCSWFLFRNGKWEEEKHPRGWSPPIGADGKKGIEGIDWSGPFCYGDRKRPKRPSGVSDPEGPGGGYVDSCQYSSHDTPGVLLSKDPCAWVWEWESLGVVVDTCVGKVKRVRYLRWTDTGTLSGGIVAYSDTTTRAPPYQAGEAVGL